MRSSSILNALRLPVLALAVFGASASLLVACNPSDSSSAGDEGDAMGEAGGSSTAGSAGKKAGGTAGKAGTGGSAPSAPPWGGGCGAGSFGGGSGTGTGGSGTGTAGGAGSGWGTGGGSGSGTGTGQPGSIGAGEWDDNENYREFMKYIAKTGATPVDVSMRQFVVVRDVAGKAVSNCKVTVNDGAGHSAELVTLPSGRTPLFPRAVGLEGNAFHATAMCAEGIGTAHAEGAQEDGLLRIDLDAARKVPEQKVVELAFVVDTTGSMGEEIAALKTTFATVASQLGPSSGLSVRIGLVAYKDYGDQYVTQVHPFTTDLAAFQKDVAGLSAGGGGDTPEAVNEALHVATDGLAWSGDAFARMLFLVGDAPPHAGEQYAYATEMKKLHARGVQAFTVAASGQDAFGQAVFRQIAQHTYARSLFILAGAAGSGSSGGGDPVTSCGGTQKDFSTGKLDALIVGEVKQAVAVWDADPLTIPGRLVDVSQAGCP